MKSHPKPARPLLSHPALSISMLRDMQVDVEILLDDGLVSFVNIEIGAWGYDLSRRTK